MLGAASRTRSQAASTLPENIDIPVVCVIARPYLIRKSAPSHAWLCSMALVEATGS
jgi:hypothetical protein